MDINNRGLNRRELQVAINQFNPTFLQDLETLQSLGLLSEAQLRDFCGLSLICPIVASLPLQPSHPNLLVGLERLVSQGVLSQEQMLQWCQTYLSEPLPALAPRPVALPQEVRQSPIQQDSKIGWIPSLLQSLMDEISVLWLLFLGVFLVVVSSAVLAASQWNSVPAAGQYGILWTYTFAFWLVSHWLGQRETLQLTAHTLQLTALLIIPVNFWMIDSFQLIRGGMNIWVALFAGLVLSGLMAYTLNPNAAERWGKQGWFVLMNMLLLSWLHWGWEAAWVPPVAIYLGIGVTGFCTVWLSSEVLETVRPRPPNRYSFERLLALTPLYSMLLLLLRGLWIEQLPLSSLGLAFGLVGAMFCWTGRRPQFGAQSWWLVGLACLGLGRLWAGETHGQALLVTLLGAGVFIDRLLCSWQPGLVWLIFITGLQGLYPLYALVPATVQTSVVAWVTSFAGSTGVQPALMSLLGLPYWWLTLWAMDFLKRRRVPLVPLVERMALGLGGFLTVLTLANSGLRVIFLVGVGVTLLLRPSPLRVGVLHSVILGAIASGIDYFFPALAVEQWALVCLVAMVGEGVLSAGGPSRWRASARWAGLLFALAGYLCLLANSAYLNGFNGARSPLETMAAWLIPLSLMGVGYIRPRQTSAQWLGVGSIFAVQFLCLPDASTRTLGFALAVCGTGALSVVMRRFLPVVVTVGWALAWGIDCFASYVPLDFQRWFWVFWAVVSLLLTIASGWLRRTRLGLAVMYGRAAFGWGYGLTVMFTGVLCLLVLSIFSDAVTVALPMPLGAIITAIAAIYQFKLSPRPTRLYLSAIAVEVSILLLAWLGPWPSEVMATGTLVAGLVSLRLYQHSPRITRRHWTILPLMFAGVGCVLGHDDFQSLTGLYTIGASFIVLWVGRRGQRSLTYVGIGGFSFGVYELLVYQILQSEGEHPGDALVIFAGVATLVAIADRIFTRGLTRMLRLSPTQFLPVAHLHWLAASLFLLTALVAPMQMWAEATWVVLLLILSVYAMAAGKIQSGFLYAGVAQGLGAIAFGMAQVVPLPVLGQWSGAIAVGFAALLSYFPWSRYGWDAIPAQRMAMMLPLGGVVLSLPSVGLTSILCAGAWYFWMSQRPNLLRLSYLGLAFGNWAVFRLVERWWMMTPMWLTILLGSSVLLVIQWEPLLQNPERREVRHWLRCFALGLMALVALYESAGDFGESLVVVLFGLLMGGTGLMLRVRSFLYVGTGLFVVKVLWLLWTFVSDHSFLLWALGIVLGIVLIWVAATFESRRTQAIAFLDYWVDALQHWQ